MVVAEDRSWWSQIALQLEKSPSERVRSADPTRSDRRIAGTRRARGAQAANHHPRRGRRRAPGLAAPSQWDRPGRGLRRPRCREPVLTNAGFADVDGRYVLPIGHAVSVTVQPPGTQGLADRSRGADAHTVSGGTVRVAGVLDLLRIVEASAPGERTREVIAYQALLDVKRAQQTQPSRASDEERLQRWLSQQTPVA